jgi:hypothetical protein
VDNARQAWVAWKSDRPKQYRPGHSGLIDRVSKERFYLPTIAKAPKRVMTQQVRPAYRKPGFPDGNDYAAVAIRTIRANFIKARWQAIHRKQAGYTDAILSLSDPKRGLAKREETIYGVSKTWLSRRQ